MAERVLRILLVEDHGPLGRLIATALRHAGWIVSGPLADPAEAVAAAQQLPLDAAVLDRRLGGEETFGIAEALAQRRIPCILISGYPRSTLPVRFQALPFLEKPFAIEALLAAVRSALQDAAGG
ncbi:MAG: response regulator [Thiohalocapsa sp.]